MHFLSYRQILLPLMGAHSSGAKSAHKKKTHAVGLFSSLLVILPFFSYRLCAGLVAPLFFIGTKKRTRKRLATEKKTGETCTRLKEAISCARTVPGQVGLAVGLDAAAANVLVAATAPARRRAACHSCFDLLSRDGNGKTSKKGGPQIAGRKGLRR